VRSPHVDVPTSRWAGSSTGASFWFIAGHEIPFTPERRRMLYPTHAAYVDAVRKNVADLVSKRFSLREDGEKLVKEAQKSRLP